MRLPVLGYTLIELLVVIAIVTLLATLGFVNFKDFAAQQVTIKAAGQIQTLLRLAQSNATSSTLCNGQGATSWFLSFTSSSIDLRCNPGNFLKNTYTLENASLQLQCSGASNLSFPATFTYVTGVGTLTTACPQTSTSIIFTISNTLNPSASPKTFSISKGGAINVQ